ncbi:MAG: DUF456 domain-containing protein [Phycisphaeraceae bacterium]
MLGLAVTLDTLLLILVIVLLLLVNGLGVLLTALQLPGTWLIVLSTSLVAWWHWEQGLIGLAVLLALLLLAVLGEVIEFVAGAWGARRAGSSKRAAALAIVGGVVGGVLGMVFLFFIPIIGALIGAAIGAGVGTVAGDMWAGRGWDRAALAGRGAVAGKFWGALGKLAVAVVMWLVATAAVLLPGI